MNLALLFLALIGRASNPPERSLCPPCGFLGGVKVRKTWPTLILLIWLTKVALPLMLAAGLPDLTVSTARVNPKYTSLIFQPSDCEVVEGCAAAGSRRMLLFANEIRNEGAADLILGDPTQNTNFVFAPCPTHRHYHYNGFAEYRIVGSGTTPIVTGKKVGFCLEDNERWSTNAPTNALYSCAFQGIQAGWSDIYTEGIACQWIDISAAPAGVFRLELEANPSRKIEESNYSNNVASLHVVLPPFCNTSPINDDFARAEPIVGLCGSTYGNNLCATQEPGEPKHGGNAGGASIWYRWVAPSTRRTIITTEGSTVDTILAVYVGSSLEALSPVAVNDNEDYGVKRTSRVEFDAISNVTYHIAIDGYDRAIGGIAVHVNPGGNDWFTNALPLEGITGTVMGLSDLCSVEPGEPLLAGIPGGHSVWFLWTAPTNASVTLTTEGSDFDTLLAVYTGASLDKLTPVASDNDSGLNRCARVYFSSKARTTYVIALDGVRGASGFYQLSWKLGAPRPQIFSVDRSFGTNLELKLNGLAGEHYSVETNDGFSIWSVWRKVTNVGGTARIVAPIATNVPSRFFRAVVVP